MWSTVKIVSIAAVILSALGWLRHFFQKQYERQLLRDKAHLLRVVPHAGTSSDNLPGTCPPAVQRWLHRSGASVHTTIQTALVYQTGSLRMQPTGHWMPFQASQWYNLRQPGFLWMANVHVAPGLQLTGKDLYFEGLGKMQIRLDGVLPLLNADGFTVTQGALVRLLAEIVWFPTAALAPWITWEPMNNAAARAHITYGGISDHAIFHFNDAGDVVSIEADRYYTRSGAATLEHWRIDVAATQYATISGIRVPVKVAVTWCLPEGDFTWMHLEVKDVIYNKGIPGVQVRPQTSNGAGEPTITIKKRSADSAPDRPQKPEYHQN